MFSFSLDTNTVWVNTFLLRLFSCAVSGYWAGGRACSSCSCAGFSCLVAVLSASSEEAGLNVGATGTSSEVGAKAGTEAGTWAAVAAVDEPVAVVAWFDHWAACSWGWCFTASGFGAITILNLFLLWLYSLWIVWLLKVLSAEINFCPTTQSASFTTKMQPIPKALQGWTKLNSGSQALTERGAPRSDHTPRDRLLPPPPTPCVTGHFFFFSLESSPSLRPTVTHDPTHLLND